MTRKSVLGAAILAIAIGLFEPHMELAWNCRSGYEATEACVWGRAYFPLMRVVTPAILSPLLFGAWFVLTWLASRK